MIQPPLLPDTENEGALTFKLDEVGAKNYLTHNFHPYPAKFIPQIPAAILEHYVLRPSLVLDPFCGSGTVAVEATLRGHRCVAVDINPIATLIAAAKTCRLTTEDGLLLRSLLYRLASQALPKAPLPDFKNRDLWFSEAMVRELAGIRASIQHLTPTSPAWLLAHCAFSAILVKCSYQESETHWRSVEKSFHDGFALDAFGTKLRDMMDRAIAYAAEATGLADIHTGSALRLGSVPNGSVDIIVTSPPYANSHDYYLYNKLRMFWLGYDHYSVQGAEIGSRHRHSDLKEPIGAYLREMQSAFMEMARVLKPAGTVAIVVGDSIHNGRLIDMGKEYDHLASVAGLIKVYHYDYDQRQYTSAFQRGLKTMPKRSHILVFNKRTRN